MDGLKRHNFKTAKKELTKNVILKFCNSIGIDYNKILCIFKSKRISENNTLEQNNIGNDSLISIINTKDFIFC